MVGRVKPGCAEAVEDADTARLVELIQAGEHERFGEVYVRYFDRVYSYLRLVLRNEHHAEELAQQVFLDVLEALPRYEPRDSTPFRGWLFAIARNRAISQLRATGRVIPEEPRRSTAASRRPAHPSPTSRPRSSTGSQIRRSCSSSNASRSPSSRS
jgi:RNA polymerase sigma factor (sigma-70 family)